MNGSSRPSLPTRWEKGICSVSSSPQELFLTLSSWPCISEKMSVSSYESHQIILPLSSQRLPFSPIFECRILLSSSNILSASVSFSSFWLLETCRPSPSPCHPGRTFLDLTLTLPLTPACNELPISTDSDSQVSLPSLPTAPVVSCWRSFRFLELGRYVPGIWLCNSLAFEVEFLFCYIFF